MHVYVATSDVNGAAHAAASHFFAVDPRPAMNAAAYHAKLNHSFRDFFQRLTFSKRGRLPIQYF